MMPVSIGLFDSMGSIDHLVITAGRPQAGHFKDLSIEDAKNDFELNFWSKYKVIHTGLPYMIENGSIVLVSGVFGQKLNAKLPMTSVSSAAIDALVKTLATSIQPIRVNGIAPYVVETETSPKHLKEKPLSKAPKNNYLLNVLEVAKWWLQRLCFS